MIFFPPFVASPRAEKRFHFFPSSSLWKSTSCSSKTTTTTKKKSRKRTTIFPPSDMVQIGRTGKYRIHATAATKASAVERRSSSHPASRIVGNWDNDRHLPARPGKSTESSPFCFFFLSALLLLLLEFPSLWDRREKKTKRTCFYYCYYIWCAPLLRKGKSLRGTTIFFSSLQHEVELRHRYHKMIDIQLLLPERCGANIEGRYGISSRERQLLQRRRKRVFLPGGGKEQTPPRQKTRSIIPATEMSVRSYDVTPISGDYMRLLHLECSRRRPGDAAMH